MSRNSEILKDFSAYCEANPELRFWQALRNWSGYHFILAADMGKWEPVNARDTFGWEGKREPERHGASPSQQGEGEK